MSTNEERTYLIPSWNVGKLRDKIFKMNSKAAKLGCPEVHIEIIEQFQQKAPGYEDAVLAPMITIYKVAIRGEGPKINGWKFVGTLDHYSLPGSVIVNTVPGECVPQEYYNSEAICDHCGKIRRRIETFIVEDEDEHFKQVGRQCLKDFLGHDPKAVANHLTGLMRFLGELEDEEWARGGCGREQFVYDHLEVLQTAAAVIRKEGWLSRSNAQADLDGKPATADLVMDVFLPPSFGGDSRRAHEHWVDGLEIDNPRNQKDAEDALAWLNEQPQPSTNEYMHNLHAIAGADGVPTKMFGYWCSLVSSYYRAQEKLAADKASNKLNEHFGNVKERVELAVEVATIRNVSGEFGGYSIVKMHDVDGHTFMWFTSSYVDMEIGHKYNIRGTIKKHEEYNNWKQTHLARVAVIGEIS